MQQTVKFEQIPGSRRLFLDFLSGKAAEFYRYPFTESQSFASVQQELSRRSFKRDQIVAALTRQNRLFGAGAKTFDNISKLKDPAATAVFTGQQVGIFGGQLLVFYKAALAVKLAQTNCRKLQTPVVPIFWLAADDADFAEVASVTVPGVDDKLVQLAYQPVKPVDGQLMGLVRLDKGITRLLDEYEQALPPGDFRADLMTQLREFYQPGESIVTAFGRYLSHIFKDTGLILVDPSDPEFRRLAEPVFEQELKRRDEASRAVEHTNERLVKQGYHLQVAKTAEYSNLFYCQDQRSHIEFSSGGFKINGHFLDQADLLTQVKNDPTHFAPNVFLRPIVQSHIFPTLIYFAGPAEAAYFAQMSDLYELYGEVPPVIYPRFSATIIERNIGRLLEKNGLGFEDVLGDTDQLIVNIMKRTYPGEYDAMFENLRTQMSERLERITASLDRQDHGAIANARRIAGRIDVEIQKLSEKVFQAHRRKNKIVRQQVERAAFHLYPRRQLQERVFPLNYYFTRYGPWIVERLLAAADCNSSVHHLVSLDQAESDTT